MEAETPMWSPFRRRCASPVAAEEQAWIEGRFDWLTHQFGVERMCAAPVVLPSPRFFPDPYHGRPDDLPPLFGRVCGYLGLDPSRFDLALYSEADRPRLEDEAGRPVGGTAGLYQGGERPVIWVEYSQLADPPALVATLVHEACHDLLLGSGRLRGDEPDYEPVTDLLSVFLGLGVLTANSTIRESYWTSGNVSGWRIGRQGYLTQPMYGYALALFAWQRGERKPPWAGEVRLDVRVPLKQGLRYLGGAGGPDSRAGRS
jgi:hypothetical protein